MPLLCFLALSHRVASVAAITAADVNEKASRDCALKALAYEFGVSRGLAIDRAALWDGLLGEAHCADAPSRPSHARTSPPLPPPPSPLAAPLRLFVSASSGHDAHAGTAAAPFATLQRAQAAIRASACRRSSSVLPRPCAVVVSVAPGVYDLADTLTLDERDSRVTWRAQQPGSVKVTGSVRIPVENLTWTPLPLREGVFKADLSAVLPPHVKAALLRRRRRPYSQGSASSSAWDYGEPPALVNQLFVDDERQVINALCVGVSTSHSVADTVVVLLLHGHPRVDSRTMAEW
jgi:hypothetical protein